MDCGPDICSCTHFRLGTPQRKQTEVTRLQKPNSLQHLGFLDLIQHARVPHLLHIVHLLLQNSHGCTVALDGSEPLRRLNLPLHNELPHLQKQGEGGTLKLVTCGRAMVLGQAGPNLKGGLTCRK